MGVHIPRVRGPRPPRYKPGQVINGRLEVIAIAGRDLWHGTVQWMYDCAVAGYNDSYRLSQSQLREAERGDRDPGGLLPPPKVREPDPAGVCGKDYRLWDRALSRVGHERPASADARG